MLKSVGALIASLRVCVPLCLLWTPLTPFPILPTPVEQVLEQEPRSPVFLMIMRIVEQEEDAVVLLSMQNPQLVAEVV